MATQTAELTDLELLHRFVGEKLSRGERRMRVEECLTEFHAWRDELERLREEIRPALERSRRGESKPLDIEDIKRRGRERLEQQGISDP